MNTSLSPLDLSPFGVINTTSVPGSLRRCTRSPALPALEGETALATLPGNINLTYLAEGASNIVYRIHPSTPPSASPSPPSPSTSSFYETYSRTTPPPSEITPLPSPPNSPAQNPSAGQLLRLRKHVSGNTSSVWGSYQQFRRLIAPLFPPESLVTQFPILLPAGLAPKLNTQLRELERQDKRPRKRCGAELDMCEEVGMLVTDMTMGNSRKREGEGVKEGWAIEFKPKWLAPSPNAPFGAKRCRTCALRVMKDADARREQVSGEEKSREGLSTAGGSNVTVGAKGEAKVAWCPLKLLAGTEGVRECVDAILVAQETGEGMTEEAKEQVVAFLIGKNDIVQRLRTLQLEMDPNGVLKGVIDEKFLIAMAVRDCTLFMKIPPHPTEPIEARLGDLDIKPATEEKIRHWRGTEQKLIDGGWYTATEGVAGEQNRCLLATEKQE